MLEPAAFPAPSVGSFGSWGYRPPSGIPAPSHAFANVLARGSEVETRWEEDDYLLISKSSRVETKRLAGRVPILSTRDGYDEASCGKLSMFSAGQPSVLRMAADCSGRWEAQPLPGATEDDPLAEIIKSAGACPECSETSPAILVTTKGKAWWTVDRVKFHRFSFPSYKIEPKGSLALGERRPFIEDPLHMVSADFDQEPPPFDRTWLFNHHIVWQWKEHHILCSVGRVNTSIAMQGTDDGFRIDLPPKIEPVSAGHCGQLGPVTSSIRFDEVGSNLFVTLGSESYRLAGASALERVPTHEVPRFGPPLPGMPTYPTAEECQSLAPAPHVVGTIDRAPVRENGYFTLRGRPQSLPFPMTPHGVAAVGHVGHRVLAFDLDWLEAFESDDDGQTWVAVGSRRTTFGKWQPTGPCWKEPMCSELGCVLGPVVRLGWDLPAVPRPRKHRTSW